MTTSGRRRLVLAVFTTVLLLEASGQAMVLWHHLDGAPHGFPFWLESLLGDCTLTSLGVLLMARRPDNRVGLVLVAAGATGAVQLCTGALASMATVTPLPRAVAVAAAYLSTTTQLAGVTFIPLLFLMLPDGRLLSRRWRPAVWALFLGTFCIEVCNLGTAGLGGAAYLAHNPLHWHRTGAVLLATDLVGALLPIGALAALAALALRYRRSTALQRQQLKWVFLGAATALFLVIVVAPLGTALAPPSYGWIGTILWATAATAVPASIGLAAMRYRLYDLDRIVSRTVSYLLLTALVVGVYVGLVLIADAALPTRSSLGVAGATLAVAAIARPLHRRLQRAVDRRFNRARYDAEALVDEFARGLREQVDMAAIAAGFGRYVCRAVEPSQASIWLREVRA